MMEEPFEIDGISAGSVGALLYKDWACLIRIFESIR